MTVPIEELGRISQCNGVTTDFLIPFRLLDPSHLEVTLQTPSGTELALLYGTDYTVVTVAGDRYCRTVAVYEDGASLVFDRATPSEQQVDFTANDPFPPETVEVALDRQAMLGQELRRRLLRGVAVPAAWEYPSLVLPQYQAGRGLVWDPARPGHLTNGEPVSVPEVDIASRIVFAPELGLALDGVTDDSRKIQDWADAAHDHGGGMLVVIGRAGAACRLDGRIRGGSGCVIAFIGCEVRAGREGGIAIRGEVVPGGQPLRLAAPVSQGATVLPILAADLGGTPLSTAIPVGASINLTSTYDAAGTDVDRTRYSVTGVDDGLYQLTLHRGTDTAYASGTVRIEVSGLLAADAPSFAREVDVFDGSLFAAGDWVMIEDDRPCASSSGPQNVRIRQEVARLLEVDGDTLKLNRDLEHDFATAHRARVVKLNPVVGCEISGANIVLVEEQDAYDQHICDIRYAVSSRLVDITIDHDANLSRPSNNFRIAQGTFGCSAVGCAVLNPRFHAAGQGYCFRAAGATDALFQDCTAEGGRIGFTSSHGATRVKVVRPKARNQSNKALDTHGQDERVVTFVDVDVDGFNALSDGTRYAISAGNPTWQAGSREIRVEGGRIAYKDAGDIILYACPPAQDVTVTGVRIDRPWRVVAHADVPGAGTLVAQRIVLENCQISQRQEWLVWARGKQEGASVPTLLDFYLRNVTDTGGTSKLINVKDVSGVFGDNLDVTVYALDGVYNYSVYSDTVDFLELRDLVCRGARNGLNIKDTANVRIRAEWLAPASGTTVIAASGTNSGTIEWTAQGYTPSYGTSSGEIAGLTFIRSYPTPP